MKGRGVSRTAPTPNSGGVQRFDPCGVGYLFSELPFRRLHLRLMTLIPFGEQVPMFYLTEYLGPGRAGAW